MGFVQTGRWSGTWRKCPDLNAGRECKKKGHYRHEKHWGTWYYATGGQDSGQRKQPGRYVAEQGRMEKRRKRWWQ
jgi:hypothetical protein